MKQGHGQRNMHAPHQSTTVWQLGAKTWALETSSQQPAFQESRQKPQETAAVFLGAKSTHTLDTRT